MITAAEIKTLWKHYRCEFFMNKTFAMKWPAEATKKSKDAAVMKKDEQNHNCKVHHRKLVNQFLMLP